MIVPLDDIKTLLQEDITDFKIIPIDHVEITSPGKKPARVWEKEREIPKEKIAELEDKGVQEIDILFTRHVYECLCTFCPENYRLHSSVKSFIEIDKIINTYRTINRSSKRQRSISFLHEFYNPKGGYEPLIRFNETIDFKKWNSIKRMFKKDSKLPILYNEIGIIVFVDLTQKGDGYIDRFKKNADLCTLLAQRKSEYSGISISSDFNSLTDIWTVNEPENLLETYIEHNARLIILGDTITKDYKDALMKVKKYDKFARFFVATDINPSDFKPLLLKIKKAYNTDNYTIE